MNSDSFDPTAPDPTETDADPTPPDYPRTETPTTATGEKSTTIEGDEDAGILPTPEPTDGGAPAP